MTIRYVFFLNIRCSRRKQGCIVSFYYLWMFLCLPLYSQLHFKFPYVVFPLRKQTICPLVDSCLSASCGIVLLDTIGVLWWKTSCSAPRWSDRVCPWALPCSGGPSGPGRGCQPWLWVGRDALWAEWAHKECPQTDGGTQWFYHLKSNRFPHCSSARRVKGNWTCVEQTANMFVYVADDC